MRISDWSSDVCSSDLDNGVAFHAAGAVLLALASVAALLLGPWSSGLDPAAHVYPATVWLLAGWTAAHVIVGVLMLLYCIARRAVIGRAPGRVSVCKFV